MIKSSGCYISKLNISPSVRNEQLTHG